MRRLALRRLRGDEGLTLLETVVALLVFSLIMTGLAGSMAFLAKTAGINSISGSSTWHIRKRPSA